MPSRRTGSGDVSNRVLDPASILPPAVRAMLAWNPMVPVIEAYQAVLVHGAAPAWGALGWVALLALVLCAFGMRLFRKRAGEMVDEL